PVAASKIARVPRSLLTTQTLPLRSAPSSPAAPFLPPGLTNPIIPAESADIDTMAIALKKTVNRFMVSSLTRDEPAARRGHPAKYADFAAPASHRPCISA